MPIDIAVRVMTLCRTGRQATVQIAESKIQEEKWSETRIAYLRVDCIIRPLQACWMCGALDAE